MFIYIYIHICWLVVSTHMKNISRFGSFPQIRVQITNIWHHHLVRIHTADCWWITKQFGMAETPCTFHYVKKRCCPIRYRRVATNISLQNWYLGYGVIFPVAIPGLLWRANEVKDPRSTPENPINLLQSSYYILVAIAWHSLMGI